MIYLELFLGFLEVGLFSFGGAYAAIPLIRDVVLKYDWLSDDMLAYFIGVCESTPGPIMVNLATYVGSSQAGLLGALIATTTVVLPAFAIILLIVAVMDRFLKNPYVNAVMNGLKPCVIGIILAVGIYMLLGNLTADGSADICALIITGIIAVLCVGSHVVRKKKLPAIPLIGLSAVLGIVVYGAAALLK